MCSESNYEERRLMKYVELAEKNREFEIKSFWTRTGFFGAIVSLAFTGLISIYQLKEPTNNNPSFIDKQFLANLIINFGIICSFCWYLANLGAKFWQNNWEQKADLLTDNYFNTIEINEEKSLLGAKRFSVSKLTTILSIFVLICWIGLSIRQYITLFHNIKIEIIIPSIITGLFIIILYIFGRSIIDKQKSENQSIVFKNKLKTLLTLKKSMTNLTDQKRSKINENKLPIKTYIILTVLYLSALTTIFLNFYSISITPK